MSIGSRISSGGGSLSILHVVPYFPPDRIGGVGEVVSHLHHGLLRHGHTSRVLTAGRTPLDPTVVYAARSPVGFIFNCWRHVRLARQAEVVNVHHGEALGLILTMRALGVKTPVVLTLHVSAVGIRRSLRPFEVDGRRLGERGDRLAHRTFGMRVRHRLDRWAMAMADQLCFISKSVAHEVLDPDEASRARVIYNGLPERSEPTAPLAEAVELLFVGTYSVRKRVQLLPLILAAVRNRRPGCRMRVIGFAPEDHPEFLHLARSLDVDDAFLFEGRLSSRELAGFYRAARVLLVPSAYEGLPMVILEALQHGLPCVATRVSGHPEVIEDGRNGYLVPPDRPDEMAESALRILEDPELGRRMGAVGRAVVAERFGVERQVREYVAFYREVRATFLDEGRPCDSATPP